jgi:hypothetical protein
VEEQADPKSAKYKDMDRRTAQSLPCPEHGDPRLLLPENQEALEIYRYLDLNHIIREVKQGDKVVGKWIVDVKLALMLCQAWGVEDVPETLAKLSIIHKEYYP